MRQGTQLLSGRSLGRLVAEQGILCPLYHVARRQLVVSQLFHPIEDCKLPRQDKGACMLVHMKSALKGGQLPGERFCGYGANKGDVSKVPNA